MHEMDHSNTYTSIDERHYAALTMLFTLAINTIITWSKLTYFPIEFSQMGWGKPGAAGGYMIMACGTCLTAIHMFPFHVRERSFIGCLAAVFMALLGLVNGNDVPLLQTAHGVVAFTCFVLYIAYIYVNDGPMVWLYLAGIALILGHTVIFTQLDIRLLFKEGMSSWPRLWTEAQAKHPVWILRVKALCQIAMLLALFVSIFHTDATKQQQKRL